MKKLKKQIEFSGCRKVVTTWKFPMFVDMGMFSLVERKLDLEGVEFKPKRYILTLIMLFLCRFIKREKCKITGDLMLEYRTLREIWANSVILYGRDADMGSGLDDEYNFSVERISKATYLFRKFTCRALLHKSESFE